jgi:hypothetical protein
MEKALSAGVAMPTSEPRYKPSTVGIPNADNAVVWQPDADDAAVRHPHAGNAVGRQPFADTGARF